MTKADIDLAHRLVGELGHCAHAMDQYGNARIGGIIRAAANLLEKMVKEAEEAFEAARPRHAPSDDEQRELSLDGANGQFKHAPSDVYRKGLTGDANG
jgi:hypothetical protein